jgi:hypothetical protein
MPRIGTSSDLVLSDMLRFQTRKTGRMAKVKSQMTDTTLYRKVRAMMTSIGTQVPFCCVFQKNDMGLHCRRVTKKKTSPVRTVSPMAMLMIQRWIDLMVTRRRNMPMETLAKIMAQQ